MLTGLKYPPRLRFINDPIDGDNAGAGGGTFTQEQVDQIVTGRIAQATRQAQKAAEDALAEKLQGANLDDLLAARQAALDAEEGKKTEAQRALDAANATKVEAEQLRDAAKTELHQARVTAALTSAGVPAAGVAAISVPGVTVDSTPEEIKAAVDKLKTDLPGLFTTKAARTADPGNPPARHEAGEAFGEGGQAEFERRFPAKK